MCCAQGKHLERPSRSSAGYSPTPPHFTALPRSPPELPTARPGPRQLGQRRNIKDTGVGGIEFGVLHFSGCELSQTQKLWFSSDERKSAELLCSSGRLRDFLARLAAAR
ncbi:hypothetical protein H1C71_031824 [Ictidomys tridecemlineatus]|nr:hypothetical protein H1C71_031824 [Ictidomys tridecemlineatus]